MQGAIHLAPRAKGGPSSAAAAAQLIHRRALTLAIGALTLLAPSAGAATFGPTQGMLLIRAGTKPQLSAFAIFGEANLSDFQQNIVTGGFHQAVATVTVSRASDSWFDFYAVASSVTTRTAAPTAPNALASISLTQSFTTTMPQWLEFLAEVNSPDADPDVSSLLTLTRSGQAAPVFSFGNSGGLTVAKSGLHPAGEYTIQGSITTFGNAIGTHSGVIEGSLLIAALADFDGNAVVDGADLGVWKSGFGSTTGTFADGNLDGDVDTDGADFLLWQRQLGTQSSPAPAAAAQVPEPSMPTMLLGGALSWAGYCRTSRSAARRASTSPAR